MTEQHTNCYVFDDVLCSAVLCCAVLCCVAICYVHLHLVTQPRSVSQISLSVSVSVSTRHHRSV
jgi:hypothetical protein